MYPVFPMWLPVASPKSKDLPEEGSLQILRGSML